MNIIKLDTSTECTLVHGDSKEFLKNGIHEDNIVIVTDPPFNVGYHYDTCTDNMHEADYIRMITSMIKRYPSVIIHYPEDIYKFAIELNQVPNRVVTWIYNSNTAKQHRDIAYFGIEPNFDGIGEYKNPKDKRIIKLMAEGRKPRGYDWIYQDQVKNVSKDKTEHPCQMPIEVMDYIMKTLPKDIVVLDPFAGSGTTLLAANRNGIKSIGVEMSDNYCKIIKDRLSNG